jgi:hypothetical protein
MFSNDKLRLYLFIFLAFAVLSSKNILIYNEETLVALSFFFFFFFVLHYFGNTIKESLNERSQVIREELQNFLILKEKSFQDLLNQHQKVSRLMNAMVVLNTFTKNELNSLNSNSEKALNNLFSSRIQNKLKTLVLSKLMMQQTLQSLLSEIIISNVLVAFPKAGKQAIQGSKNKAISNALSSFITNKQNNR